MHEIDTLLTEAADITDSAHFRDVVWNHCGHLADWATPAALELRIHPGDQMLRHSLKHHRDAATALSQYYNVALQQHRAAMQVVEAMFPGQTQQVRFLDFACGFGRLLRFLTLSLPPANISASELQTEALGFVEERFGVKTLPSHVDPARFEPSETYDVIWAASLFSHLPARLFDAWLERLMACLSPNGILCFSVHDACLMPAGLAMPPAGLHFTPLSENDDLDRSTYGTTYVNEGYVLGAVARASRPSRPCHRIPRCLAHEQDLYVVCANPGADLSPLQAFRYGPWGWVDEKRLSADGELYLRGWAASLDSGALEAVDLKVDGVSHACPTGRVREDVARFFNDERLRGSGWEFRQMLPADRAHSVVTVSARTVGESALLYSGTLSAPSQNKAAKSTARRNRRRLFLHVGPHKTGTTYIQKFFLDNRLRLLEQNLLYPERFIRIFGHHEFREALAHDRLSGEDLDYLNGQETNVLLSSEDLISLERQRFESLRRCVDAKTVTIVYTWRRASLKMYSIWQEVIKHGGTPTFFEYYHHHLAHPGQSLMLSPDLLLGMYASVFGKDNIVVLDYEASTKHDSLLEDFLKAVNVEWAPQFVEPKGNLHALNRSMDHTDIEIIRALNVVMSARYGFEGARARLAYGQAAGRLLDDGVAELREKIRQYEQPLDVGGYYIDQRSEQIMVEAFGANLVNYEPCAESAQILLVNPAWIFEPRARELVDHLAATLAEQARQNGSPS